MIHASLWLAQLFHMARSIVSYEKSTVRAVWSMPPLHTNQLSSFLLWGAQVSSLHINHLDSLLLWSARVSSARQSSRFIVTVVSECVSPLHVNHLASLLLWLVRASSHKQPPVAPLYPFAGPPVSQENGYKSRETATWKHPSCGKKLLR